MSVFYTTLRFLGFSRCAMAILCCASFASVAGVKPTSASPLLELTAQKIDRADIAGAATVRWLGFRAFDAVLVTPNGAPYDRGKQAALELQYAVSFSQDDLMNSTMAELDRLEGTQQDHPTIQQKLRNCFKRVGPEDKFLAIGPQVNRIELFRNGVRTCTVSHANIRARFLDIWLSPNSRFPSLSRKLRGQ